MVFDDAVRGVTLTSVQRVKELSVGIASNLRSSRPGVAAANKANRVLGFMGRNFPLKNKDVTLLPYNRLVRPHLE